jgi:hypothetical protein
METDVLFWTFLAGLGFALNACCIFLLLVRHGQYRDPEKSKFIMFKNEMTDDLKFSRDLVNV